MPQVQAVLLLLGGRVMPSTVPSVVGSRHLKSMVFEVTCEFFLIVLVLIPLFLLVFLNFQEKDAQRLSNASVRQASLNRFREKRKERCFDKKIRYDVRQEVALRYVDILCFLLHWRHSNVVICCPTKLEPSTSPHPHPLLN